MLQHSSPITSSFQSSSGASTISFPMQRDVGPLRQLRNIRQLYIAGKCHFYVFPTAHSRQFGQAAFQILPCSGIHHQDISSSPDSSLRLPGNRGALPGAAPPLYTRGKMHRRPTPGDGAQHTNIVFIQIDHRLLCNPAVGSTRQNSTAYKLLDLWRHLFQEPDTISARPSAIRTAVRAAVAIPLAFARAPIMRSSARATCLAAATRVPMRSPCISSSPSALQSSSSIPSSSAWAFAASVPANTPACSAVRAARNRLPYMLRKDHPGYLSYPSPFRYYRTMFVIIAIFEGNRSFPSKYSCYLLFNVPEALRCLLSII